MHRAWRLALIAALAFSTAQAQWYPPPDDDDDGDGLISPYQKFYLVRDGPNENVYAPVSVAYDPSWDDDTQCGTEEVGGITGWTMAPMRGLNASGPECMVCELDPADEKTLIAQYISQPLRAGTISGQARGVMRFAQDDRLTTLHDRVTISLRVVSNNGSVVRGTLLALNFHGNTSLYAAAATPTARLLANNVALNPVVAQLGDRLVLEIGTQPSTPSASGAAFVCLYSAGTGSTDLTLGEVDTDDDWPWFELVQ